jgi:hypothetical protein
MLIIFAVIDNVRMIFLAWLENLKKGQTKTKLYDQTYIQFGRDRVQFF